MLTEKIKQEKSNINKLYGKQKNGGKPVVAKKFKVRIQESSKNKAVGGENGHYNHNIDLQLEGEAIQKKKIKKEESKNKLTKTGSSETFINK